MTASTVASRLSTLGRGAAQHPGWAAFALALLPILLLGGARGGYDERVWRPAGLAFAAVAGIGLLLHGRLGGRLELLALASLACLAGLMLASSVWGIEGTDASYEAQRCMVYVAALSALLLIVEPSTSRLLLAGVVAGSTVLAGYALTQGVLAPSPPDPYEGSLLTGPVGYANAFGLLVAIGSVVALGLALDERQPERRLALLSAGGLCAVASSLTASRGAWLATFVGLVVLVAVRWGARPGLALLGAGLLAASLLAVASHGTPLGDRPAYWRVALSDVAEHPLSGSGAGSFDDYWLAHRPIPAYVRDAHSLYLEAAAELGLVGLALLACALAAPFAALLLTPDRRLLGPAAAGYAVFLVHSGLDWDWEMPVTVVAGLACGVALLVGARRASSRPLA